MTKPVQPYVLGPLKGNGHSDGYSLNIHEEGAAGGLGTRICQIPAFTWRSQKAVLDLGRQLAATPVLIAALKKLAFAAQITGGTAGRDENLQEAIDEAVKALAIARGETVT